MNVYNIYLIERFSPGQMGSREMKKVGENVSSIFCWFILDVPQQDILGGILEVCSGVSELGPVKTHVNKPIGICPNIVAAVEINAAGCTRDLG